MAKQGVSLHVWGEYALFTRPEMKVERVSYDVITPSAARGVIEAIYWKPEIRWRIDKIHVLKPIRVMNLRRNEVDETVQMDNVTAAMQRGKGQLGLYVDEVDSKGKLKRRQQRAAVILRDVGYVLEASFEIVGGENNPGKHLDQFNRRAREGKCHMRPYLGCREFSCHFALVDGEFPPSELPVDQQDRYLGFMLYDIDFKDGTTPQFYEAEMKSGIIDVRLLKEKGLRS